MGIASRECGGSCGAGDVEAASASPLIFLI